MMDNKNDHWTGFWSQGFLTTFPSDYKENYDKGIRYFWMRQFEQLPDNATILDLCCGNGAVAILAAEFAEDNNKPFKIIAVDAAKLNLNNLVKRHPKVSSWVEKIEYLSGTRVETLNLPEATFDLILSQFGIEYLEDLACLSHISQALKPEGRMVWVTQPDNARARQSLTQEVNEYRLLDNLKFFARVKKFLRNDASQKEMQGFFREVFQDLSKSLMTRVSPMLKQVIEACQFVVNANADTFKSGKPRLFAMFRGLTASREQLRELQVIYQRFDDNPQWFQVVTKSGFCLSKQGEVHHTLNQVVGSFFSFEKA